MGGDLVSALFFSINRPKKYRKKKKSLDNKRQLGGVGDMNYLTNPLFKFPPILRGMYSKRVREIQDFFLSWYFNPGQVVRRVFHLTL